MKVRLEELEKVKEYQEEKNKFYLLNLISKTEGSLVCSDLESYIIGRSRIGLPTWIWTSNSISPEQFLKLEEELEVFLEEGENKFTAKKPIYELLKKEYDTSSYFEMGFLTCTHLIKPLNKKGIFVRPNYGDKDALAKMWIANEKEIDGVDIRETEALETAQEWLDSRRFYVLKDSLGKIVCMAGYTNIDDTAKITHVFTPKEERGKGYCKSLIYELTKRLQDEGFTPLLYTNYNYESSNKAYKSVGYSDEGILINFNISKEKDKKNQL